MKEHTTRTVAWRRLKWALQAERDGRQEYLELWLDSACFWEMLAAREEGPTK